jgi:Domain of unknown function (DUF4342)
MLLLTNRERGHRAPPRTRHMAPCTDHEEFTVRGPETVARIRRAVRDGNVRRIWIKDEDGRTLIELPFLLGVRGGPALAPVWAAVRALAAASGTLTVQVRREAAWPPYLDHLHHASVARGQSSAMGCSRLEAAAEPEPDSGARKR